MRLSPCMVAMALFGCTPPTNGGPCQSFGTGEEPCRQQLYFPSGLAFDPAEPNVADDRNVLYVASGNADLRYSGGTVAAIDVDRFECAAAIAAGEPSRSPAQCDAAQAMSDATGCRPSAIDPAIVECDETPFMVSAVKVGNFAGSIRLQRRTGDPKGFNRRLWLTVRGDPSVTFVNAIKPYRASLTKDPRSLPAHLDCEASNSDPNHLEHCSGQRLTVRDFTASGGCQGDAECPSGSACTKGRCDPVALPPEPFGLFLNEGLDGAGHPYAHLAVAHLLSGQVTLINAAAANPASTAEVAPTEPVVLDVRGGLLPADRNGRRGAFALAPLHVGDAQSLWFLSSRLSASIALFRVSSTEPPQIVPAGLFSVAGAFATGDDVRDLQVQEDGSRAFFLQNHPPSLFTLDVRQFSPSGESTLPADQVVDIVPVCEGPSRIGLRQWQETGAEGAPPRTVTRVFVVCFVTGQVAVIDPDLGAMAANILVGRGPNEIAFNFSSGVAPPLHRRAYVTNYTDSTVAVIDLDRGSRTENRVIARIGITSPPGN